MKKTLYKDVSTSRFTPLLSSILSLPPLHGLDKTFSLSLSLLTDPPHSLPPNSNTMLFSLLALPLLAAIFPNVQAQAITPGSIPGRSALDPPSTLTTKTSTTSTCTTIVNLGLATDLPSCFVYDGATYRDVCPVKHSELEQCPWLCTSSLFMNRPYVCSLTDLSNSNEFTFCQDCLTGSKSKVALTTLSPVVRF